MDDDWLVIPDLIETDLIKEKRLLDITAEELLQRYAAGERDFEWVEIYGRNKNVLVNANLSGVNLRFANFAISDLTGCNLSGADLTEARLRGVCLVGANLSRANLSGADLYRTSLRDADLSYANLTNIPATELYTDLVRANLTGANLRNANLEETRLSYANLTGADLTGAIFGANILHHTNFTNAMVEGVDWGSVRFDNTIMPDGSIRN